MPCLREAFFNVTALGVALTASLAQNVCANSTPKRK